MPRNGIWFEARVINNSGQSKLARARSGKLVLSLVLAEQFQEKNSKAPDEFKQADKSADQYVNTYTAWHRLQVFADDGDIEFMGLVRDPLFNHGAVVEVEASYQEEKPWEDRGGKVHAGRRESIFWATRGEKGGGSIGIKRLDDGRILGARDEFAVPFWDGVSELPALGGSGGGAPAAPQYGDDEGF